MLNLVLNLPHLRGVVHVGGHYGQEGSAYRAMGVESICWVEALPSAFSKLIKNESGTKSLFFQCALGATAGEATFYVADNEGQSSSLRKPREHLREHPEVAFAETITVPVRRLSDLPLDFASYNLLVMDVQGCELDVLLGAGDVLSGFDYIVAEVQCTELYEGGALLPELAEWLAHRGFACERVEWQTKSWGNALFVHESASCRPSVHGFIFHWGKGERGKQLAMQTHTLADLIGPEVDKLTVISSGGTSASGEWLVLDEEAYFGTQWNRALAEFSGEVLFHHQADAFLLGADYAQLVAGGRQSFRAHHCGVYAPRVDHSAWDGSHRSRLEIAPGRYAVQNTDCTCWMIHRSVLHCQPRKLQTQVGWGIDVLYCDQARYLGLEVLRDYRFLVHHPMGTGYKANEAGKEMKQFQACHRASPLNVAEGWGNAP